LMYSSVSTQRFWCDLEDNYFMKAKSLFEIQLKNAEEASSLSECFLCMSC